MQDEELQGSFGQGIIRASRLMKRSAAAVAKKDRIEKNGATG